VKVFALLCFNKSTSSWISKAMESEIPMGAGHWKASDEDYHYHEDARACRINREILSAAGGTWKDPPADYLIDLRVGDFRADLVDYIREREEEPRVQRLQAWGWKNPSTVLTWGHWADALQAVGGRDVHLLPILRDPEAIGRSIGRRVIAMDEATGRDLADYYHERIRRIVETAFFRN